MRNPSINVGVPSGKALAAGFSTVPTLDTCVVGVIDRGETTRTRFDFSSLYVSPRASRQMTLVADQVVGILRRDQTAMVRRVLDATTTEEFVSALKEIA